MDIVIIAHFITEFIKDGTSRFVYIAEHLSKQHSVELITSSFDHISKQQRQYDDFDLQTKVTMLKEPSYPKNVCLKRFVSHAYFGRRVEEYLESREIPDVIYCAVPSLNCAYYAARYSQKNNVKFIIDIQDLWPEAFKMVFDLPVVSSLIFSPMKRKADYIYSCADSIVAVSETYCNRAKRVNKKGAASVSVFLGTKLENFDKFVEEYRVERSDGKFILAYCGTLGHSYDIKCILDAMIILREKGCANISFWVMGDGPLRGVFEEYSEKHELDVVFYGRVSYKRMCGLLASCDACVNPIRRGATQSIINKHSDYAASGLPVINTQSASEYRELIDKYACGINCECSDSDDVAKAVRRLMDNRAECASLGAQSRRMAEELFDRRKSYIRIYELFE